ncbi:peptide deformylase [Clostridium acetobutylicum]|uniref:Peptide deformylase 2 n=1 Tax=Clostridium acetobutylicum (strain ATCC 824 / DSM 792 / JCM 1419 / IAM 19013 / LMG 5710 / NBRC 13948 / NRRL B-527 / VKM B-1787 / 2291 / W) TaxID=272562 RepID=DEF2_CLOAB|nr:MULTISPECIES: peptide deformylase [Clostridium]Q97G95.1 RecName: Full=Peptide deformylase 2; Short=PDF 2; AltName: Full=Polypeptide deformylase 2 [Clostridium acetobutylicum ATCC 824]AAK80428.1 N-formylmethionyl-tRNA deformylase [Clostridium acetobutylicum ATCC 824]ADZ21525.1 N-formylmethionyl-tRNA deformylase [Clostridium acetobutylicum EA 2018]AEI33951.1 N-formylmethionyl-tRNA deformylase [Clostridium acetobutylicum DSM 1731]AWV79155.1 peptide deformylase [Clostridium acetobutylicum]MBC2
MALRQIRLSEDEILRKKSRPVEVVDDKIRQILDDMLDTLQNTENGAAIAAPQVGILKQLVVIATGEDIIKLVNPKIVKKEGEQEVVEGCLSIPNVYGKLKRPKKVTVEALNENGEKITLTGEGFLAKCFCHEIDHLDGILFTDLVTEYIK